MEMLLLIIRLIAWVLIFQCVAAAGINQSIPALIFTLICMTYWFWRYPPFKKDKSQED